MIRDLMLRRLADLSRRLPIFRGKGRLQRTISRALYPQGDPPRALEVELDGLRWELDVRELIQFRLLWDGTHEPHVLAWLTRELAQRPHPVLWDVGANIGAMSLFAARRAPAGARVESFEPSPRVHARLARQLALNPGLPVRAHRLALSDRAGTADFHESAEVSNGGLGTLYAAPNTVALATAVETARGDDLIASGLVPPPDVMKIDVEGFEPEVLDGLASMLATHHPVLCVESSAYRLDSRGLPRDHIAKRLEALGYRVTVLAGDRAGEERAMRVGDLDGNHDLIARPPHEP